MAKFVVVYRGGQMEEAPADVEAVMATWMSWFQKLGLAVTDHGNPFGASTGIDANGKRVESSADLTGYSIVEATSLDDAVTLVKECPNFAAGGSLEIYEAMAM